MDSYGCTCFKCFHNPPHEHCETESRLADHCEENGIIITACYEVVTLIVGPQKGKISCHKALLGYYSEYFDALFYGNFVEAGKSEFDMTDELADHVKAFIAWVYTGYITNIDLFPLWVLGDKLRCPEFTNDVMRVIYSKYRGQNLSAAEAEFAYSNCSKEAKLRKFVKELILCEGPLSKRSSGEEEEETWLDLIAKGGDLVTDIAREGSFTNWEDDEDDKILPYKPFKQHEFLEPITTRPLEDFVQGKMRDGTR